ncbi:MAG: DNA replication and repair protein RecF [Candidatus Aureabacteria bacterium]|nr:DNA replication and repair protein RecF [Candidatus Auribacterota bacterium]
MWVQDLAIHNFRNIERADLRCGSLWNVIFGRNAQGKTNILEAVYFLTTLRSFRTKNANDLLRSGADSFLLKALILTGNLPCRLKAGYEGGKKKIFLNEESLTTLEKVIGVFPIVLATGRNIDLVGQPPAVLRRFLDGQLSQSIPDYLKTLLQYEKVLRSRNLLIKQNSPSARRQLKVWTEKLTGLGARIFDLRRKAVKRLGIFARLNLKRITEEKEELEVRYITQAEGESEEAFSRSFEKKMMESASRERDRGFTLVGPHRDHLVFLINGLPAHKFASTGQRKSIGFALKMAEAENIRSFCRTEPVMLLDEIFNEVDEARRKNIYALIPRDRQVFCTTAEREILKEIEKAGKKLSLFRVTQGEVETL